MLHFFPASFPDETLYSRVARYHRLTGYRDDRASLHELVGLHTHVVVSDLPSRLSSLLSRFPEGTDCTVEEIVECNTALPYFTAFVPAERRASAMAVMSSSSVSGLKMSLGLMASRLGGKNNLRFCRYCVDADYANYGQPYWHRAHQLPGAWVCQLHEEPLYSLSSEAIQLKRHKLLLPDHKYVTQNSKQLVLVSRQFKAVLRISRLSDIVLRTPFPLASESMNGVHRAHAVSHKLINANGRLRVNGLSQLLNVYACSLPQLEEYAAVQHCMLDWVLKLLRKPKGCACHPMKHILLMDCLRTDDGAHIWCPEEEMSCPVASNGEHKLHATDSRRLIELINVRGYSLSNAAAELGLSTTTVAVAAVRAGIKVRHRPKRISPALRMDVKNSLQEGLSTDETAKKSGISIVSVYRILRMDPQLEQEYKQKRFSASREAHRNRFIGTPSDPATCAWLRKNDRRWLSEHRPENSNGALPRFSVDWSLRDQQLSRRLIEVNATAR